MKHPSRVLNKTMQGVTSKAALSAVNSFLSIYYFYVGIGLILAKIPITPLYFPSFMSANTQLQHHHPKQCINMTISTKKTKCMRLLIGQSLIFFTNCVSRNCGPHIADIVYLLKNYKTVLSQSLQKYFYDKNVP